MLAGRSGQPCRVAPAPPAALTGHAAPQPDFTGLGKIAALGIKVSRHCSYHGLALNVAMDLEPFQRIHPCGYLDLATVDMRRLWRGNRLGRRGGGTGPAAASFIKLIAGCALFELINYCFNKEPNACGTYLLSIKNPAPLKVQGFLMNKAFFGVLLNHGPCVGGRWDRGFLSWF